ncbi:MAG: ATP-binding protein [Vicinamibacterales bacterium]
MGHRVIKWALPQSRRGSRRSERGARLNKTASRSGARSTGSGLGLSIVKAIVSRHEGMVTASSIVGRGTSMQIRLPRLSSTLAASPSHRNLSSAMADVVASDMERPFVNA